MSDIDIREGMSNASSSKRYQAAQPAATASQSVPVLRQRASLKTGAQQVLERPRPVQPSRPREQSRPRRVEPITRATGPKLRPLQAQTTAQLDLDDEQDAEMSAQTTTLLGPDPATNTDADIQVHMPPVPYRQPARAKHQGKHPLVWVGLTTLTILLGWILSTGGASWWATHVTDPGTYGLMHGTVVTGVFGGGDSTAHPTKLIAMNNDGRVAILKITAGDPKKTQVIPGPDLVASGFPNPKDAEVELQVDSHHNVIVTIYASDFGLPFHRTSAPPITLSNDGKGNLKQTGGQ